MSCLCRFHNALVSARTELPQLEHGVCLSPAVVLSRKPTPLPIDTDDRDQPAEARRRDCRPRLDLRGLCPLASLFR
jgi:hypothetical protein